MSNKKLFVTAKDKDELAHIRELCTSKTLCGLPVGGWIYQQFLYVTQAGCKNCRRSLARRTKETK